MFNFKKIISKRGGSRAAGAFITIAKGGTVNASKNASKKIDWSKPYMVVLYEKDKDAIMIQPTNTHEHGAHKLEKTRDNYLFTGVQLYQQGAHGRYYFFAKDKTGGLIFVKNYENS